MMAKRCNLVVQKVVQMVENPTNNDHKAFLEPITNKILNEGKTLNQLLVFPMTEPIKC